VDLTRNFAASNVEDFSPVYAPDGQTIAFARRFLNESDWTPGRQLWVMDAQGQNASQLTFSELHNHLGFAWHPDGSQIALLRSNQADLYEPPEIWLIQSDGSDAVRLVINGFAPQWLP
jgi:Tol biopolymer transport system component